MRIQLQDAINGKCDLELNIAMCEWLGWQWMNRGGQPTSIWLFPPDVQYDAKRNYTGTVVGKMHYTTARPFTLTEWTYGDEYPEHVAGVTALGNMRVAEEKLTKKQLEVYMQHIGCRASARNRVIALLRVVRPELFI